MRPAALVLLAALALAAGCRTKTEPGTPKSVALTGDLALIQGEWRLHSVDEERGPPIGPYPPHVAFRVRFDGDTCTVNESGNWPSRFTVTLLEDRDPKVMKLTEIVETTGKRYGSTRRNADRQTPRDPDRLEWLYKFDGEHLVVAFHPGAMTPAPAELKAREPKLESGKLKAPGVVVLTLQRVEDPDGVKHAATRR